MPFNSVDYFILLGGSFLLFWGVRSRSLRLWILLAASYAFYASWNGLYLILILLSTTIDYCAGQLIHDCEGRPGMRRLFLFFSIISNLAILGVFKYGDFALDNAGAVLGLLGMRADLPSLRILLPIGISFYTFQSMSYTLDIYLGRLEPARSARDFFLFVAFFPQLVAGPIVRARELLPQFDGESRLTKGDFAAGVYLILRGLVKKMVVADFLAGSMVDPVFNMPELFSSPEVFLALAAFHFQVYCDFSGYTDIALGSARLFGFRLPENFAAPYAACTPSRFWRRWHMTLTRFAFDYLYVPLGGSRRGSWAAVRNILLTFGIIGFWHGADWKYVLFGLYHGAGVVATRLIARLTSRDPKVWEDRLEGRWAPILLTNVFIIFSLPLFRAADLRAAWEVYGRVFAFDGLSVGFAPAALALLAATAASHYVPEDFEERLKGAFARVRPVLQGGFVTGLAFLIERMALLTQRTFIYFRF